MNQDTCRSTLASVDSSNENHDVDRANRLEYMFEDDRPMIEFNERTGSDTRPTVLKVDNIQLIQPADSGLTTIVLQNGRTVLADLPYIEVRRIVLEARSQFVSVL